MLLIRWLKKIRAYGGAAGGGKSFGLLLSALRYKNVPGFGCTIFRRNFNQIFSQGGLWDESLKIYSGIRGAQPQMSLGRWKFCNKDGQIVSTVKFAHIERDDELSKWQGSQICEIGFDELTHFSEKAFFYMLSRNRSSCGVTPFVRATCNPDADSWVAKFIEWWIDQETGYPIPERSGKIRWFIRRDEILHWANTKEELWERFNLTTDEEKEEPRSVTFIMSRLQDNKELLKVNPQYMVGRMLNMDGLETMKLMAAKKTVIKAVRPGLRLDGKSRAYINAAFDCAVADVMARSKKDTKYQKKQMFNGDSRTVVAKGDSASAARERMIKRQFEKEDK